MLVMVSTVDTAGDDNAILLDCLTCKVALEEPENGISDQNILLDMDCRDENLYFRMPGGSGDHKDEGDARDKLNAITTATWRPRPSPELERFDLASTDVDRYRGRDGDYLDADEMEQASQANAASTLNVEYLGDSSFDQGPSDGNGYECEDGDDADADEEEDASQADDGST